MLHRKLAVFALLVLLVPSLASAQRRTRGEKSANWDEIEKQNVGVPRFSTRDIEKLSAVQIVVEKRKDVKLSDDQVKQLRELNKQEAEALKPRFVILDSLRNAMRPRPGVAEDVERARTTIARQEVMAAIESIREGYDSVFKETTLPLLQPEQQDAASQVVERERTSMLNDLSGKLGVPRAPATKTLPARRPGG